MAILATNRLDNTLFAPEDLLYGGLICVNCSDFKQFLC